MTVQQHASLRGVVPMAIDLLTAAGMLAMRLVMLGVPTLQAGR